MIFILQKKHLIISFIIVYFFGMSHMFSQDKKIKAVELKYNTTTNDTVKLNCLVEIFNLKQEDNNVEIYFQKAKLFAEKLIKKNNFKKIAKKSLAEINITLSGIYIEKGEKIIALNILKEGLKLSKQCNDLKNIARAYHQMGIYYYYNGNITSSLLFFNKSISISKKNKFNSQLSISYEYISGLYSFIGNSEKEFEYLFKSLYIAKKNKLKEISHIYCNIGVAFQNNNDLERAFYYYQLALKSLEIEKNDKNSAYVYKNISIFYGIKKYYEKTIEYAWKALKIDITNNNIIEQADLKLILGMAYRNKGDFNNALKYYDESYYLFSKINLKRNLPVLIDEIGKTYYLLDSVQKKDRKKIQIYERPTHLDLSVQSIQPLDMSLKYLKYGEKIGKKYGNILDKRFNTNLLKKIYFAKGHYKKAYKMFEKEVAYIDTINKENEKRKGIEKELQYEYNKKVALDSINLLLHEKSLDVKLENEKTAKKTAYFAIAILILVSLSMYLRFRFIRIKKEIIIEKQRLEVEKKYNEIISTELDYLKAQINPHFLFNSLNTIYFKINKLNKSAREALLGFSEILRYQLYECNLNKVYIDKELKYLQDYVHLQMLRNNDNCKCIINISENVKNIEIAPLILITFVENAFKYLRTDLDKTN